MVCIMGARAIAVIPVVVDVIFVVAVIVSAVFASAMVPILVYAILVIPVCMIAITVIIIVTMISILHFAFTSFIIAAIAGLILTILTDTFTFTRLIGLQWGATSRSGQEGEPPHSCGQPDTNRSHARTPSEGTRQSAPVWPYHIRVQNKGKC